MLGGLLERLVYLSQGLSFILAFIGVKLILEALHENQLPFAGEREPLESVPHIPTWLSLTVIVAVLVVATIASLMKTRGEVVEHDDPVIEPEQADDIALADAEAEAAAEPRVQPAEERRSGR